MNKALSFPAIAIALALIASSSQSADIKSNGSKGFWRSPGTWIGGVVPTPSDNVTIADGDTVIIDVNGGGTRDLTVGEGTSGTLLFRRKEVCNLSVHGDLLIRPGGVLTLQETDPRANAMIHHLNIVGDLTNHGVFDMRVGIAGRSLAVCAVHFTGWGRNSTITMHGEPSIFNNEFASIWITKDDTSRVFLGSDIYLAPGGTNESDPVLTLIDGIVVTGSHTLVQLDPAETAIVGGSDSSYVLGNLARGMGKTSYGSRFFPCGDNLGYRPVKLRCASAAGNIGHYVRVSSIFGDANTGSSTFAGDIDKVSEVRYYEVSYHKGANFSASSLAFDRFSIGYGFGDGVESGNSNLRVAISDNTRSLWTGIGPVLTPHVTALDPTPRLIDSDTSVAVTLGDGESLTMVLARKAGTTENTLRGITTEIVTRTETPGTFELFQNYPNPFNPSTTIRYGLPQKSSVRLTVINSLGQQIATLVQGEQEAGYHEVEFNASRFSSGIYFCRMLAGDYVQTRKLVLVK